MSLQPWTKDKSNHLFQYNYSEHKYQDNQDLVSKLPILECELIIGNKRLIETNIDQWGNSTFEWVTIGQEPTWHDDENNVDVTLTTFTLGVNPKIGDYIIGTEFDIQNTVSIPMNIEVEGTAIPIRKSDNLSGALQFKILGPVNSTWNDITRRHPTWFRHTKWTDNDKIILAHLESIIIKDLECKIYSDNAQSEGLDNNELIYLSDETDRLVNKMEKTFKFITQPSAQDITEKGLKGGVNLNAVLDTATGTPIGQIYNAVSEETANAEEHYIDAYYTEYSRPRVEMTCTLHNDRNISWRNNYESGVLDRNFYVTSISEDVKMNNVEITLKEV